MPRIPVLNQGGTVPGSLPAVRLPVDASPASFGGGLAAGLQSLGAGATGLASDLDRLRREELARQTDDALTGAQAWASEQVNAAKVRLAGEKNLGNVDKLSKEYTERLGQYALGASDAGVPNLPTAAARRRWNAILPQVTGAIRSAADETRVRVLREDREQKRASGLLAGVNARDHGRIDQLLAEAVRNGDLTDGDAEKKAGQLHRAADLARWRTLLDDYPLVNQADRPAVGESMARSLEHDYAYMTPEDLAQARASLDRTVKAVDAQARAEFARRQEEIQSTTRATMLEAFRPGGNLLLAERALDEARRQGLAAEPLAVLATAYDAHLERRQQFESEAIREAASMTDDYARFEADRQRQRLATVDARRLMVSAGVAAGRMTRRQGQEELWNLAAESGPLDPETYGRLVSEWTGLDKEQDRDQATWLKFANDQLELVAPRMGARLLDDGKDVTAERDRLRLEKLRPAVEKELEKAARRNGTPKPTVDQIERETARRASAEVAEREAPFVNLTREVLGWVKGVQDWSVYRDRSDEVETLIRAKVFGLLNPADLQQKARPVAPGRPAARAGMGMGAESSFDWGSAVGAPN